MSSRSSTLNTYNTCGESCVKVFAQGSPGHDWNLCLHPQGWVYFYNPSLRIVVDYDIRKPGMLESTHANCAKVALSELPEALEIHLHLQERVEAATAFNLLINHSHCVASYDLKDVKEPPFFDPNKLNRCRRLYWNYLWNHPVHAPLPPRAMEDASDALCCFYTDNLISGTKSTVPFSKTECGELSRIIRDLSLSTYTTSTSKTAFISWFLREVCSFRDANSWGMHTLKDSREIRESHMRARRTKMVYPSPVALALLNFINSFLFFGIPKTYQGHVKIASQYQGRLTNMQQNWEQYVERLVREYSHFLLIATVLLSATVGFLSVPDIPKSAAATATISTLASLGSIIVGVFFIWRHQAYTSTTDSFTYMHNAQRSAFGLYGHSVLLSLPPTLLVWAILSFSITLILHAIDGIGKDETSRISVWTILGVFVVLSTVVVLTLYTFSIIWKFRGRSIPLRDRVAAMWRKRKSSAY